MCVIITKPAAAKIPLANLRQGNLRNPHGWGVAVRLLDNSITIHRGYTSNGLIRTYRKYANHDLVVHCRIGTSGTNGLENTHPFEVIPGLWLFHNGIFSPQKVALTTPNFSDTWHFTQMIRPIFEEAPNALENPEFLKWLEDFCGYGNKLVFFGEKQGLTIINKSVGKEREDCWYSNYSAFPPVYRAANGYWAGYDGSATSTYKPPQEWEPLSDLPFDEADACAVAAGIDGIEDDFIDPEELGYVWDITAQRYVLYPSEENGLIEPQYWRDYDFELPQKPNLVPYTGGH